MVGGNYVVGFVLFLALIAIQYLVVSHGAVRTAEVTARFTLDAMPGKQMAIDADLNAGLIDEAQARARREQIAREAEFYGAMDGAARFNQRDSLATILITAINIIAGFLIGVFQLDIPFPRGAEDLHRADRRRRPGHHDSVAAGLDGRRHGGDARLLRRQPLESTSASNCLRRSRPLWIAGGRHAGAGGDSRAAQVLLPAAGRGYRRAGLARTPKLAARSLRRRRRPLESKPQSRPQEALEDLLKLDELSLEVGYGLVPLVDASKADNCWRGCGRCASNLALQLGFIVPPVHITDNLRLKPREYVISLRGVEIARWEMQRRLPAGHQLRGRAAAAGRASATREPAFGVAALWIARGARRARRWPSGYAVVDQTSVLATHLAEVIKQHAYELLTPAGDQAPARPPGAKAIPSWSKNWCPSC